MNCKSCGQPSFVMVQVSLTIFDPLPPWVQEYICMDCLEMAVKSAHNAKPPEMPMTVGSPFFLNCVHYEASRQAV